MAKIDTIWRKISYLHSHHDKFFLHKGLGVVALLHYMYRFYSLVTKGSMGFKTFPDWLTLSAIFLHSGSHFFLCLVCELNIPEALSLSALIFKTPIRRTSSQPMMWKEFQLHSITFAMRSLGVMLLIYLGLHRFRAVVVITCHYVADQVTKRYKQGTTMRDMPLPDVLIPYSNEMNLFYSTSQLFAIVGVLVLGIEEVFLILFPIQFAAFLLTLVRKNIIGPLGWHALYTLSLLLPYLYLIFFLPVPRVAELLCIGITAAILRFKFRCSKYMIWIPLSIFLYFMPSRIEEDGRSTSRWSSAISLEQQRVQGFSQSKTNNSADVGNKQKDPSVLSFIASMVKS